MCVLNRVCDEIEEEEETEEAVEAVSAELDSKPQQSRDRRRRVWTFREKTAGHRPQKDAQFSQTLMLHSRQMVTCEFPI